MHKFILKFIDLLRQFVDFVIIVILANTVVYMLYWIERLINHNWNWLKFLNPHYDNLVGFFGNITDCSFYIFSAHIEIKYFAPILVSALIICVLKFVISGLYELERLYKNARISVKKYNEKEFNKSLYKKQEKQEKEINRYIVMIYTQLKNKMQYTNKTFNIDEQNLLMNTYIKEKTNTEYLKFQNGFMYQFSNYENIDQILDILFNVVKSEAPLDYAICIQVDKDLQKLNKLISLKQFGKITITADTAYRYGFNNSKKYTTAIVGVFQYNDDAIEIHEFIEKL